MKRIDFYKRLYYMLVLISIKIVLLSAASCITDPETGDKIPDDPIFYECNFDGEKAVAVKKTCDQISSSFANETICSKVAAEGNNKKCIYDSANSKCKEALLCKEVDNTSVEDCKNAPTSDDTKKICIYDESKKACQEIDKPAGKTKDGREKKKSGDWKTVKIIKEIKALKRYRIVKRLKKLKGLKN